MEYLTASNEAGRFMEEEPYEWYGSGMTEDSSISLEAPRKWRLVREQTGHGAFYGMQIVIYGECIAPSLVQFFLFIPGFIILIRINCLFGLIGKQGPNDFHTFAKEPKRNYTAAE
jgi:hypothetical protein